MIIKNVQKEELELALENLNKYANNPGFERNLELRKIIEEKGNIIFYQIYPLNQAETRWNVRLYCRSKHAIGHRLHLHRVSYGKNPMSSKYGCWDAHGNFFDCLMDINPNVVIISAKQKIYVKNGQVIGNWIDINIGSIMYPVMYSSACECRLIEELPTLTKFKQTIDRLLHRVKYSEAELTPTGIKLKNVGTIRQSQMTGDCWLIQIWGLRKCAECEFKDTSECGGGLTLKKMLKAGA